MTKQIHFMNIQGPPTSGLKFEYDQTNHKLLIRQSAGFTPAGTVAAPTFTGTPISPGTPAGTVDPGTHVFAGSAMGNITPAGSNSAPAFTGTAVAAAALAAYTGAIAPTVVRAMVFGD